jgi:hypothetical protein
VSPHGNLSGSFILYLNPVLLSTDFENIQDFNGNSMEKCYRKIAERPLEYLKKRCYIIDKRSATDRRLGPRKYGLKNNR